MLTVDFERLGLEPGDRVIDMGCGAGRHAFEMYRRGADVVAFDQDADELAGVLELFGAMKEAGEVPEGAEADIKEGDALSLPFADGEFDGALSSFVFQLVANRARALREARRVLKPGGILSYVTWLDDERVFTPDAIFDEVLDGLDIEPRGADGRSGDIPSVERAAGELRRAGFSNVSARGSVLEHHFPVDHYLAFLTEFDEETLFAELEPDVRERVVTTLRERLGALSPDQMTMRFPIVFASGRRSRA